MPDPAAGGAGEAPVRILFLDADGTLTDGVIVETPAGDARNFWVRDGLSLLWARHLAVLPVVSYSGPLLADLLTGSFVIENIFQIPGIGVFLVNSSLNRDYTLIVGLSLLYAILLIGLNLLVDFAYTLLDPRVKYE